MKALNAPGVLSCLLADLRPARLYVGINSGDQHVVLADKRKLLPGTSQRVWNHSPTGFCWGYGGSGPAQLALALLLHVGLPKKLAVRLHQALKWSIVAKWPQDENWHLPGKTLVAWIEGALEELARQEATANASEDDEE